MILTLNKYQLGNAYTCITNKMNVFIDKKYIYWGEINIKMFCLKGSIMEAAQNRPSFQTYLPNLNQEQHSPALHRQSSLSNTQGQSHANLDRRGSEPYSPDVVRRKKDLNPKRHSMLVESNISKEEKDLNRRSHDAMSVKNLSMGWQKCSIFKYSLVWFRARVRFYVCIIFKLILSVV